MTFKEFENSIRKYGYRCEYYYSMYDRDLYFISILKSGHISKKLTDVISEFTYEEFDSMLSEFNWINTPFMTNTSLRRYRVDIAKNISPLKPYFKDGE